MFLHEVRCALVSEVYHVTSPQTESSIQNFEHGNYSKQVQLNGCSIAVLVLNSINCFCNSFVRVGSRPAHLQNELLEVWELEASVPGACAKHTKRTRGEDEGSVWDEDDGSVQQPLLVFSLKSTLHSLALHLQI